MIGGCGDGGRCIFDALDCLFEGCGHLGGVFGEERVWLADERLDGIGYVGGGAETGWDETAEFEEYLG